MWKKFVQCELSCIGWFAFHYLSWPPSLIDRLFSSLTILALITVNNSKSPIRQPFPFQALGFALFWYLVNITQWNIWIPLHILRTLIPNNLLSFIIQNAASIGKANQSFPRGASCNHGFAIGCCRVYLGHLSIGRYWPFRCCDALLWYASRKDCPLHELKSSFWP